MMGASLQVGGATRLTNAELGTTKNFPPSCLPVISNRSKMYVSKVELLTAQL